MQDIYRLVIFIILAVTFFIFGGCKPMSKHAREIGTPDLPYITIIRTEIAESTVVVYNSRICGEIGEACGFFRSHAYAHKQLGHKILLPEQYADSLEHEADCWAARHADPSEVMAAFRLLSDEERLQGLPISGNPSTRAIRIRECARKAGNWSGHY